MNVMLEMATRFLPGPELKANVSQQTIDQCSCDVRLVEWLFIISHEINSNNRCRDNVSITKKEAENAV